MTTNDWQDAIVRAARGWIGTPYRHQTSLKGVGCDCLGLVRGVWREVIGPEPEAPPPYVRGWAESGARELILEAAERWFERAQGVEIASGDVLLFRVRPRGPAKHLGIATGERTMVHAYDGHAVAETQIHAFWMPRLVARFRFPLHPSPLWGGAGGGGGSG